ncbi:MAG: FAD-dependent oxidoreductase [Burkholderiaceae bacterium]
MHNTHRRQFLLSGVALAVAGCRPGTRADAPLPPGGFVGQSPERGHALRDATSGQPGKSGSAPQPAITRRVHTLIAGGGVAGLAAARALRLKGRDDFALLELEDTAGGNARAGQLGGLPCPLGAHYLPLPSNRAPQVQDLLEELGLRQRVAGRWVYDERHLCHSPQERLFFQGEWQPGLLLVDGVGPGTLDQYRRFAARVRQVQHTSAYAIPVPKWPLPIDQIALDAMPFEKWLATQGLTDPHLRAYLDYCCRDDYGAGLATVSAWAGLHYFASRHGFTAPGEDNAEAEPVLTWPEGNGWLTAQLAAPLGDRLHTGQVVLRIEPTRHGVDVLALNTATAQVERWLARRCVVALPVFVAARVVQNAPAPVQQALQAAAQAVRYAPWVVTNLHLRQPLADRGGAAPAWDNVLHTEAGTCSGGLGYVNATHQSLLPVPGPTVLTHYRALGDDPTARQRVLAQPWTHWYQHTLADLHPAHPELAHRVAEVSVARYGHAMAVPTPGFMGKMGAWRSLVFNSSLSKSPGLAFAHSDWAGYSVFEEAFAMGHGVGAAG